MVGVDDLAPGLVEGLRRLGDEYGPLGVAQAAALLTDKHVLVKILTRDDLPPPLPGEGNFPRSVFPSRADREPVPWWAEDETEEDNGSTRI